MNETQNKQTNRNRLGSIWIAITACSSRICCRIKRKKRTHHFETVHLIAWRFNSFSLFSFFFNRFFCFVLLSFFSRDFQIVFFCSGRLKGVLWCRPSQIAIAQIEWSLVISSQMNKKRSSSLWRSVMKWYHVKCSPVDQGTCIFCRFQFYSNLLLLLFQSNRNGFEVFVLLCVFLTEVIRLERPSACSID